MKIISKEEAIKNSLFETNEYMIVGCYLPHEFLRIMERHIFAVPLSMFKREPLMAQWISDMGYYTQSQKIKIPKAVSILFSESLYAILPENVPLKIEEKPNEDSDEDRAEWYFSINNINIGCIPPHLLSKMEYIFCDDGGMGQRLFNIYRDLFTKMEIYPKAIVKKYGIMSTPIDMEEITNN